MNFIKKSTALLLVITLICFVTYQPAAAQIIPINLLGEVEKVLYGATSDNAILQRIERMEKTLYNKNMEGSIVDRANRIVTFVLPDGDKPSLVFLINTLEWTMNNRISDGMLIPRLEGLEKTIYGEIKSGSVAERLSRIASLSLPDGKVPAELVTVPENELLRIRLLNKISSSESQIGQVINYELAEDVRIENSLIIPAGTTGTMKVVSVSEAGQFGKTGDVELEFSKLNTIDGTPLALNIGEEAQEENKTLQLALGASLLGAVLLSNPVGLIAGYFVKGKEEDLPAGTELYVQTTHSELVYGLKLN